MLRIGFAGAGFASKFHHRNLRGLPAVSAGVTSVRPESRQAFSKEFGVPAFASVEAMLPHIDVLDICTPPSSHASYIRLAAEAGKHIIVEKPFAGFFGSPEVYTSEDMLAAMVEEMREMRELIARTGVTLGYAENYIYAPSIQREREVLEKDPPDGGGRIAQRLAFALLWDLGRAGRREPDRQRVPSPGRSALSQAKRRSGATRFPDSSHSGMRPHSFDHQAAGL